MAELADVDIGEFAEALDDMGELGERVLRTVAGALAAERCADASTCSLAGRRRACAGHSWEATMADVHCTRPPEGWTCSREPGHDGPCAAYPPPLRRPADRGPQHFIVGLVGGFVLGLSTAVSFGWWPL
jgi:hypothetical protein